MPIFFISFLLGILDKHFEQTASITDFDDHVDVCNGAIKSVHLRLDEMDRWCTKNKGQKLLILRPGNRGTVEIPDHLKINELNPCRSYGFRCLVASLMNLLYIKELTNLIPQVRNMRPRTGDRFKRIGDMADHLCHIDGRISLVRRTLDVNGLSKVSSRFFLVRLLGSNGEHHCILVDGNKKQIVDSFLQYKIKLSEEGLEFCVGMGSDLKEAKEVCKSEYLQASSSPKRTSSQRRK